MKRYHLFEFEDFAWFPAVIRDGGTDFLGFIMKLFNFYSPSVPLIEEAMLKSGQTEVLDLCSGNGGPVDNISSHFKPELGIHFKLTDKFPNIKAWETLKIKSKGRIDFYRVPIDVMSIPHAISGFRTMFSAIHHFRPEEVEKILRQNLLAGIPLGFFDSGDKNFGTILGILIFHPLLFILLTPFFKPFSISRLIFTYFIPLIPLYTVWDGIISILRLYRPDELLAIAKKADPGNTFEWKSGKVRNKMGLGITYLIGIPIK